MSTGRLGDATRTAKTDACAKNAVNVIAPAATAAIAAPVTTSCGARPSDRASGAGAPGPQACERVGSVDGNAPPTSDQAVDHQRAPGRSRSA